MKIFIKFLLVLYVALPSALNALEVGKWSFEETDEYCYIGSLATETDLPSDKKRGDFYVLVYKNIGNPETIVQIEAGYSYKVPSDIIISIDKGEYQFYTTEDLSTSRIGIPANGPSLVLAAGLVVSLAPITSATSHSGNSELMSSISISFS